jgi:hypothetical protein
MLKTRLITAAVAGILVAAGFATPTRAQTSTAPLSIARLALINAATQQELRTLADGDTIVLATDGTALNIRADVTGTAGCVAFYLDGGLTRTENVAPYAIAGDTQGVFAKWTPALGSHSLRVVPFSLANRAGTAGAATQISFTVVKTASTSSVGVADTSAASLIYRSDGQLDLAKYGTMALSYDKATMEKRLGPSYLDLNPTAVDTRPTLYRPPSIARTWGYIRTNPYEIGGPPVADTDYWSDSGQLGYVPDVATDPGLDRIQTYAYYDSVYAISPRLDWTSKTPHPDLQTQESYYATLFGQLPKYPIAMVRNYGMQQNEQLTLYRDGYLAVNGTQTSRSGSERPYPGFVFPANKVPTSIAVTTANEFALVTIWDINTHQGQLAVFALEGKYLPFHTWPYMGLPNQGSWSAFKLLGYIDLPMATPTAVAAASNGWWSGPSQTGGLVLSQIDLANDVLRTNVYSGGWAGVVAKNGYAVVSSLYDSKVAIVDLTPLFTYMRESYLSSAASYQATIAARGPAPENFPQAFAVNPAITPKVVWQAPVSEPTCVLAGHRLDRWSPDRFKAYVAARDGTVQIIETSSIMQRNTWERRGPLAVIGSFNVGRNPTSMCFARRCDSNLPLLPLASTGKQYGPDPLNNLFYIAVRGERKVVAAVTYNGAGAVYRTIQDTRMGDPVAVSTAVRGPVVSVADFRGRKMLSYRVGPIVDLRHNKTYGAGADGTAPFECGGELPFAGYPFLLNSTNVN